MNCDTPQRVAVMQVWHPLRIFQHIISENLIIGKALIRGRVPEYTYTLEISSLSTYGHGSF